MHVIAPNGNQSIEFIGNIQASPPRYQKEWVIVRFHAPRRKETEVAIPYFLFNIPPRFDAEYRAAFAGLADELRLCFPRCPRMHMPWTRTYHDEPQSKPWRWATGRYEFRLWRRWRDRASAGC